MKLCRDCKHYAGQTAINECLAPGNMEHPDYTGIANAQGSYQWRQAQMCRIHACGPDAKWFEPILTLREEYPDKYAGLKADAIREGEL